MKNTIIEPESDLLYKLKWLMFARVIFTTLLLSSTIILQLNEKIPPLAKSLLVLYGLIAGIFLLSVQYTLIFNRVKQAVKFAYVQICIDTFIVTLIIFVTGSFSSIFSFLYLVVIIYTSMLLFRKGSMIIATLCCLQYGILIDLEYYGILKPFMVQGSIISSSYVWSHVIYKIMITMVACFAVAFLSSLLAEQARKTKRELLAMERQVKRVEKMAAIGEMGAGLAHEIKNPLASLAGSIQLLKKDINRNPDQDKLMQIILREADRLSTLLSNFLLFAKPPASRLESIELDKVLVETIELFEKDGTCAGRISINKQISSDIRIEMDPVHLRQVLWNLLINAAEAIEGIGSIDIKLFSEKNKYVCIEITDNGRGMSDEIMKSIFDPFFTTKKSGTGLGLSIVHSILESYDSRLDVESTENTGTTFSLKLKHINIPT
ncbi:MAG: GHKL domain-containing protein [Deltaproteobacteria bacterium]|nr:GHKL domain-containing protein [Deltaproteobacteria bacterium]